MKKIAEFLIRTILVQALITLLLWIALSFTRPGSPSEVLVGIPMLVFTFMVIISIVIGALSSIFWK